MANQESVTVEGTTAPLYEVERNVSESEELAAAQQIVGNLKPNAKRGGRFKGVENHPNFAAPKGDTEEAEGEESDVEDDADDDETADVPPPSKPDVAKKEAPAPPVQAPQAALPELTEEVANRLAAEIIGDTGKFQFEKREKARLERELAESKALGNELLRALRGGAQAEPEAPQAEEPDFFSDPDKAVEGKLNPLQSRIESLERKLAVESIRSAEAAFAAETPGYFETLQNYRSGLYQEYLDMGVSEDKALDLLKNQDRGIFMVAQETGVPPWKLMHRMASRFLAGAPQPAQPVPVAQPAPVVPPGKVAVAPHVRQAPARQDGSIAAARAATSSPAATSLSESSGDESGSDLSFESLLSGGMQSMDIRRLMAQGGKNAFNALITKAEKRALAERRR